MRNGQAYQQKTEKFFFPKKKSLVRLTPEEVFTTEIFIQRRKREIITYVVDDCHRKNAFLLTNLF